MSGMTKSEYRQMSKQIWEEVNEFVKIGKDRLHGKGITFSVFKGRLYELIVVSSGRSVNPYALFTDFCYVCGSAKEEFFDEVASVDEFINQEFASFEMSTHGIRLKSKPDDRL